MALLQLSPQVKHGVVHADSQTYQQDDGLDLALGYGVQVADRFDQPECPNNGGEAEQEWYPGCDQGPESDKQDDQRDG